MKTRLPQWYGWRPDLPDARDLKYAVTRPRKLPEMVDLRGWGIQPYDQASVGACVGNSVEAAHRYELFRQDIPDFAGSRLFVYYNARVEEGGADTDGGAMIRDAIKSLATQGVCPETDWPYDTSRVLDMPNEAAYAAAKPHLALEYRRLSPSLHQMLQCLASGVPFVFGFTVYDSFESDAVAATGVLGMPIGAELKSGPVGGHAVLCVGYDQIDQTFLVRNSWGLDWGQKGHFTMPFAYLTDDNLSDDRWAITKVEGASNGTS